MKIIEGKKYDEERALYDSHGLVVEKCLFDGPADGESALKESSDIEVKNTYCNLRYPFWHDTNLSIIDSEMTTNCRAAIWYSKNVSIKDTIMHGIKALRECSDVKLDNCEIISPEFGWSVIGLQMNNCTAESEYFMLRSSELEMTNVHFTGKYSFQYVVNAVINNCEFNTKDAFWHSKNVYVKDSIVNGEYLGWYSDGLTLENCTIKGTQPLCYCRNLRLINCKMIDVDFCFEKSDVEATITTPVISIKNPLSGTIYVPEVESIIMDDPNAKGKIFNV